MDYSLWLSVFGSVTGFIGLLLHLWRYSQEKPKIDVYFPSGDKGKLLLGTVVDWSRRNDYGEPTKDISKCTFYLWTRISNKSEKPITLTEFTLSIPKHGIFTLDSNSTCEGYIPLAQSSSRDAKPLLHPIRTIEPYSAIEGYLFFGPASFIPPDKAKVTLSIKTTRKIFKTKLRISVDRSNEQRFELES